MVDPFFTDPEASVEFGSIEHGQQIVTTFTQLFLMCAFTIFMQKPGVVCEITCNLDKKLVSEFINVTVCVIYHQPS